MKSKIVIITYQSFMQEAKPHSLETMEYIADEFHMIEEFKIVEISGMIAKENTNLNLDPYSSRRFN